MRWGVWVLTCLRTQWQCSTGIQTLLPGALLSNLEEGLSFLGYSAFTWFTNSRWMKIDKTQLCLSRELLHELKTTYQNKHSLMLFNFFFYIVYFLGNENQSFYLFYKYFITKAKHFTNGINGPNTVHRIMLFYFPTL